MNFSGTTLKRHELKILPKYFLAIAHNYKTFEIRKNDRNFKVGDVLVLKEYDSETKTYTGKVQEVTVTFMTDFPEGLKEGYICMSISKVTS